MSKIANLPALAGVGLKPKHYHDILSAAQPIGFFEAQDGPILNGRESC